MQLELINEPNYQYTTIEQILINRGIAKEDIPQYLNLTETIINSPELLGEKKLKQGTALILNTISQQKKAIIIVDCDCDGYTSAALFINYFYNLFPSWADSQLDWYMHDSKKHGLSDCIDFLITQDYSLVVCPDSSSNDADFHQRLKENDINTLVLDHHLVTDFKETGNAVIINNQLSDYPNKSFSGVGIVWQFCRYIDKLIGKSFADNYLDLVALGLTGDMMSLKSFETKYLISKGFEEKSIKNPFIEYMIDKNSFPLSKSEYKPFQKGQSVTPIGAAFFIVPFINAVTRSGTIEEKNLLFLSMLNHKAFTKIPSTKKGHRIGEEELLVIQTVRVVGNVKNRQTRAEKAGMELLEKQIVENQMLNDYFLLFLVQPNQIAPEIRGLVANKLSAKYQRPCAVLTETETLYEGSMRGYTKNGVKSFKNICEQCSGLSYVEGHNNAAGLGIYKEQVKDFFTEANALIKECSSLTPTYKIDYYFNEHNIDIQRVIDIAELNDFWGQDIDRAFIGFKFKITNENFHIMKSNTLKFSLSQGLSVIKFGGTEEDINNFTTNGYKEIEAYCECSINEWNGQKYPQLILKDYHIVDSSKFLF